MDGLVLHTRSSFSEHVARVVQSPGTISLYDNFPLASIFIARKDYSKFIIKGSKCGGYVICHTDMCQGIQPGGGRCKCCQEKGKSLAGINHMANADIKIHGSMHITESSVERMGSENTVAAVASIRKKDSQKLRSEATTKE
jgi:hypothetical protein